MSASGLDLGSEIGLCAGGLDRCSFGMVASNSLHANDLPPSSFEKKKNHGKSCRRWHADIGNKCGVHLGTRSRKSIWPLEGYAP